MKKKAPLVSVIIPVYNGERFLSETIDSVLKQTYSNIEIVIVNDGSTDNSKVVLEPYIENSNIKYFYQNNNGVASARNLGIKNANGELIAFLDQDDLWLPQKIEKQLQIMVENEELALVHGDFQFIDQNGDRIDSLWRHPEVSGHCFSEMFLGNKIGMLTVLVKRECILEAGMFDESIAITDDYDLWLKITYNRVIAYIREPLAFYRYHGENTSRNLECYKKNELKVLQNILVLHPNIYEKIDPKLINKRLFSVVILLCRISKNNGNHNNYAMYSAMAYEISPLNYIFKLPRIYIGYAVNKFRIALKR